MHTKTEELLYFLLWSWDNLLTPSWRSVDESFEGWAYRKGFRRQLARLEKQRFVERQESRPDEHIWRLTEIGRRRALGECEPEQSWAKIWDGRWRFVLFDVPVDQNDRRNALRRSLRDNGFGCLQGSVWVNPHPLERRLFDSTRVQPESFLMMEALPVGRESDERIRAAAWDFRRINELYEAYINVLQRRPIEPVDTALQGEVLREWARAERAAWERVAGEDPFLPEQLLPRDYLGKTAWDSRKKALSSAGWQIRGFRSSAKS